MFIGSALLQDLEEPTGFSHLALASQYTVAIGEDGNLRVWDIEYKVTRLYCSDQPTSIDLLEDTLLVGLASGQIYIGQISSGLHTFQQIQVDDAKQPIHAVRVVERTASCTMFMACAADFVYLAQIRPDGVEIFCRNLFRGHPIAAVAVLEKNDEKILMAASSIHGGLRIARAHLRSTNLEPWTELVNWEGQATHLHGVRNVLDINSDAKVLVECDDCTIAVIDGLTGLLFCSGLVCGSPGGVPNGIGGLFDYSGKTLIFWSCKNLPELVVRDLTNDDELIRWQGVCDSLAYPMFPRIVSMVGAVGFIWSNEDNTKHAIVIHEYDTNVARSSTTSTSSSPVITAQEWSTFADAKTDDGTLDDFYQPGVEYQNRPLDEVLEDIEDHVKDDGQPIAANDNPCDGCETRQDAADFQDEGVCLDD